MLPSPGKIWIHVIITTYGNWLHGDERGFRSRHHRIHSSGDYKRHPPKGEHAGLNRYVKSRMKGKPIRIPPSHRGVIGQIVVERFARQDCRCLAIAVGSKHLHALVELPCDLKEQRRIVGCCKAYSSAAVRDVLPGKVWGAGGQFKPVRDRQHHETTFHYILGHVNEDAWVWRFDEGVVHDPAQR